MRFESPTDAFCILPPSARRIYMASALGVARGYRGQSIKNVLNSLPLVKYLQCRSRARLGDGAPVNRASQRQILWPHLCSCNERGFSSDFSKNWQVYEQLKKFHSGELITFLGFKLIEEKHYDDFDYLKEKIGEKKKCQLMHLVLK